MNELVFFLEEASAEAMLNGLLPRILPQGVWHRCVVFEGKQDLENNMLRRMQHYRVPGAQFIVLRDQDSEDCQKVKSKLLKLCKASGKPDVFVRIACRELESWYLADLAAVEAGLGVTGLKQLQSRPPYRNPDGWPKPFKKLKQIVPSYHKVRGSRAIGPYLDTTNARSRSFEVLITGIKKICERFSN